MPHKVQTKSHSSSNLAFTKKQRVRTQFLNVKANKFLRLHHDSYNSRALGINGKMHYDEQFPPEKYFAPQNLIGLIPELHDSRVLDLGCGNGRLTLEMEKNGTKPKYIDGIDAAIRMLEIAQNENRYRRLILGDITENSTFSKHLGIYSCIVSSSVFGHIIGRGHDEVGHMLAINTIRSYFKHLTPKATIGLTLGNTRGSGTITEQSTLYKSIVPELKENGFENIFIKNLPGHIDPQEFTRNKVNYIYLVARR